MHVDVLVGLALVVLVPVSLLVLARRRRPGGAPGTAPEPDKSVLHCAAPAPRTTRRR